MFILRIHRTPRESRPVPGSVALHVVEGGPLHLLEWLETQLGLPLGSVSPSDRARQYLGVIEKLEDGAGLDLCSRSFETDPWATAAELLHRRDELLVCGWDGRGREDFPPLVRDLALIEVQLSADPGSVAPGEAERVRRVLEALDGGQVLPEHRLILDEPVREWPRSWRALLERLRVEPAQPAPLPSSESQSLQEAQRAVAANAAVSYPTDASVRFARAASATLGCRAVAALLAEDAEQLPSTVILCEDHDTALLMDECMAEAGLPTLGIASRDPAQPALQILPLVLELCWEPVDPQLLLDFLNLPIAPIPRRLAWPLADALADQPGLDSRAWEEARAGLTDPKRDDRGSDRKLLARWLDHARHPRDEGLPAELVADRCRQVAQWAHSRATQLLKQESDEAQETSEARELAEAGPGEGSGDSDREGTLALRGSEGDPEGPGPEEAELVRTLRSAAAQASALAEIAESLTGQGTDSSSRIAEAQLPRLLDATRGVLRHHPRPALAGMPRFASRLSQIHSACDRLVWLGLGTEDPLRCRWTHAERTRLSAAGIELDDGRLALQQLRRAERRGFSLVREQLLAVQLPADDERRPHPLWMQVHSGLTDASGERLAPVPLERHISLGSTPRGKADTGITPWKIETEAHPVFAAAEPPVIWRVDPDLLTDRQRSSASELQDRLGCPLKWTLGYRARLHSSDIGNLPGSFLLKGTFAHQILAEVFCEYEGETYDAALPLPSSEDAAEQVAALFDERLSRDAAPLAQPAMAADRARLRQELIVSTRVFVDSLARGGYRVAGMERPIESKLHGRRLTGYIDCLLVREGDHESVIDFKFGGPVKYRALLEQGRAVQLATYAGARQRETGSAAFPPVAYLIISTADLYTPEEQPLHGTGLREQIPGAPAVARVWQEFQDAIAGAEEWLEAGQIPIRPRQDLMRWTKGSALVLDPEAETQPVCQYCEYGHLCGLEEVK